MSIGWRINTEEPLLIGQYDVPGAFSPSSTSHDSVAYLVERRVISGTTGNRTSILQYTPAFSSIEEVDIVCTADSVICGTAEVLVYGKLKLFRMAE